MHPLFNKFFMKLNLKISFTTFFLVSTLFLAELSAQGRPQGQQSEMPPPAIGIIKGRILDEITGKPIEYGNVSLIRVRDSVLAGGKVS